ncbi:MAG: N-acetyltransferase, partial [Asticcacaulis sp.]|nr:N-acetyltransferase [Asticcacaulis sp.]
MDDMTTFSVTLHSAIADIGRDAWDAVRPDANPFTSYDFLHALEASRSIDPRAGWQATHLALRDGDTVAGVMPLYVKSHSMGEYVFDQGWARAYEQAGGDYYPKLLSAVPFTPVTGARLLAKDAATRRALVDAAVRICDTNRLSSLHINFPLEDEWQVMGEQGLLLRQDQQFWFDNPGYASFDDFLAQLSSNRRKVIRRERRDVQALLDFKIVTGNDIEERHLDD